MSMEPGEYYTRSRRRNGRISREYVGSGIVGRIGEGVDKTWRLEGKLWKEDFDQAVRQVRRVNMLVARFDQIVNICVAVELFDHSSRKGTTVSKKAKHLTQEQFDEAMIQLIRFERLAVRAMHGDLAAVEEAKNMITENPDLIALPFDLAAQPLEATIKLIAGRDIVQELALRATILKTRKQHGYGTQSPCGKLVIDSVILGIMQTAYWSEQVAQVDELHPKTQALVYANRNSAADRYDAALKNLLLLQQNDLAKASRRSGQARTQVAGAQTTEARNCATTEPELSCHGFASPVATPMRKEHKKRTATESDMSGLMASPIRLRKPAQPESDSLECSAPH